MFSNSITYSFHIAQQLLAATAIVAFTACTDTITNTDLTSQTESRNVSIIPNRLNIKLKACIIQQIDNSKNTLSTPTGSDLLDKYLHDVGANKIDRIFPFVGKDEPRQRAAALNTWYSVAMDSTKTCGTRAATQNQLESIADYTEPAYHAVLENSEYIPSDDNSQTQANESTYFNDPLYDKQWNLHNNGNIGNYTDGTGKRITSSIAHADINAEAAWRQTTGDPSVVVAVVDGGIDIHHEDLQGSIWINKNEIPGNGIDDDNNGYIDDVYGYNFTEDTALITPTRHATHVAGIIAARNNNAKGISGIAGGNGNPDTGVRLICCQIFRNNPNYDPSDKHSSETIGTGDRNREAAAIVYGANNGAIISQNSWGYDRIMKQTPQVIKDAIHYFNTYAGGDKTDKPLMQGGLVVFAAGNDATSAPSMPSAESSVVSVSSFNPDFSASWYTNYGSWTDISAPGGSKPVNGLYPLQDGQPTSAILSTVPATTAHPNGGYAYMQGTSMATPHVSAIAALIVSKYGNGHFTAKQLRERLLTGVRPIDYNKYLTETYRNSMGSGYADALVALTDYDHDTTPATPFFLVNQATPDYGKIRLAWTSKNNGADGSLQKYVLYCSKNPITTVNYTNKDVQAYNIPAQFATDNQVFQYAITHLDNNTKYYFGILAEARNGHQSTLTVLPNSIATLNNTPPQITPDIESERITLAGNDTKDITLRIEDPENHKWTVAFSTVDRLRIVHTKSGVNIRIEAKHYMPGVYPVIVSARDELGAKSSYQFIIEVVADKVPSMKSQAQKIRLRLGECTQIDLREITDDEDVNSVRYELMNSEDQGTDISVKDGRMNVMGSTWGQRQIHIKATDKHGQSCTMTFDVFVYRNEGIYSLFPTMTTGTLYLKVGDTIDGHVKWEIRNVAGKLVKANAFDTSSLDADKRTYSMDVSSLTVGQYTLYITCQGKTYQEMFVKN
ncbi:peptidase, S8/S53 family [Prevotella sp. DNF00663]|uniref:S8 family serine peptidase n=1 Tax=Prevotella sp. DNF00663 TaxID=1384078 RepID=UPI000781E3A8|nr:S8 family serine peptidase [Prevotella sp. DNF00663]KXB78599.1 peptidase, S8/S53 family [Prevotella sp. DNF00663]